jgi:hypothetical protein
MDVATMVRTEQRSIRNSERAPLEAPDLRGTVAAMPATIAAEAAIPAWVESDLLIVNGRAPLGLDAIATYRIMPELLPGILQLSRRARYFSFFAYLLSVFRSHVDQPDMRALDLFIQRAEYEYGYAVLTCERCSDDASWRTGVLGEVRLRPARRDRPAALRRGLSVDTTLGGYGLFYRNPLQALNVVAAEDTPLDDTHNAPHDVLANSRARELAAHFATAVADTDPVSSGPARPNCLGRVQDHPKPPCQVLNGTAQCSSDGDRGEMAHNQRDRRRDRRLTYLSHRRSAPDHGSYRSRQDT